MESEWTSCRIRKSTLARLHAFAARVLRSVETGRVEADGQQRYGRLALDPVLCVLLDREERHVARSKASR